MKSFTFEIRNNQTVRVYIQAETLEEAEKIIQSGEWEEGDEATWENDYEVEEAELVYDEYYEQE